MTTAVTTNLRLLGRADFGPQHLSLKIRNKALVPSFVYKGLCDATRDEPKSCVIDEHRDRQTGADYIGPTIQPQGVNSPLF